MKAIVYNHYGSPSVLHLTEVPTPSPKDDEVLIRVHASSINSRDWRLLRADPFFLRLMGQGLFKPKYPILGADVAGRVEAVGSSVTRFKPGDEVFGYAVRYGGSAFAEYVCAGENEITLKPANVTFEQAAAVPVAAMTALQGLRDKGGIQAGQKVLIQGASGGVGGFAVQLARWFGAEVTGVCSARNLELARSLGADPVIDYRKVDITRRDERFDLILAVNGYHPAAHYLRILKPEGAYVVAGGSMLQFIQAAMLVRQAASQAGGQKVSVVSLKHSQPDLLLMKDLLETGKLVPVIDACYPLSKTVDAFRYYEKEHPRGKIVITIR